jgi:5-formyltetrahydrofolate cyclo-ligase
MAHESLAGKNAQSMSSRREELRRLCLKARKSERMRDDASRIIADRVKGLPEYRKAKRVYVYVNLPTEVETKGLIMDMLKTKEVVIPYERGEGCGLFRLRGLHEVEPGAHGILEPRRELRTVERDCSVDEIDLFIMPGVAFDPRGNRLGFGSGFHDRMLAKAKKCSVKVGLAFDCQVVDEIPANETDVPVGIVVTEKRTIRR